MVFDNKILEQFGLSKNQKTERKGMTGEEILDFLRDRCFKIEQMDKQYHKSNDAFERDIAINAMSSYFNGYVQAFIDTVKYIAKKEHKALGKKAGIGSCVFSYKRLADNISFDEEEFLNNLIVRNELEHEYFSYDNTKQLLNAVLYINGGFDIAETFEQYFVEHNMLQEEIEHEKDTSYDDR